MRRATLVLVALNVLLAACAEPAPEPETASTHDDLETAVQAPLDKARAVEEDMRKARRAQDAAIKDEGG